MAVKLQTITDIRKYISAELTGLYGENEISTLINIIIASVLRISKLNLLRGDREFVEPKDAVKIVGICEDLKLWKPIQYIIGETLFHGCVIKVRPGVLIPRPETEEMVDLIVKENQGFSGNILDIGTGSGCIAVALAAAFPRAHVSAVDVTQEAVETASENARLNKVSITFIKADILKDDLHETGKTDILVSNPPYVRNSEKYYMSRNVLDFEPHDALFVLDSDPLLFYREILVRAGKLLNPGGKIYFEMNEAMSGQLKELTLSHGFRDVSVIKDINGKDRILKARKDA